MESLSNTNPHHGNKVYTVEILHPGHAMPWGPDSTGLKVITNIPPERINNRTESPILFKSDAEVWRWAKRVGQLTRANKG